MKTVKLMGTAASLLVMGVTQSAAQDLTVGYFLEWPMPFQYAKAEGMYDEALGTSVNWVSFDPAQLCRRRWRRAMCICR